MVDPERAHSGVLLCICLQKDTLIYTKKCLFLNQNDHFKYVHVTSRSLHSGSESREIISGGFVTVPFSQSLTLDLGTVASPSRSNLLWVWHGHVSGESVKAHYTGLVPALCFHGDCRRHAVLCLA